MPLVAQFPLSWCDKQLFVHADADVGGAVVVHESEPAKWPTHFDAAIVAVGEHSLKEVQTDQNPPEDILKFAKMHLRDKNFSFVDGGETSACTPMASVTQIYVLNKDSRYVHSLWNSSTTPIR